VTYSEASKEFLGSSVGDRLSLPALVVLESMHGLNQRVSMCHFQRVAGKLGLGAGYLEAGRRSNGLMGQGSMVGRVLGLVVGLLRVVETPHIFKKCRWKKRELSAKRRSCWRIEEGKRGSVHFIYCRVRAFWDISELINECKLGTIST